MLTKPIFQVIFILSCLSACGGSGTSGTATPPPVGTPPPSPTVPSVAIERAFLNLNFSAPVQLLQAPGDSTRWFILEKNGVIRVFSNDPNTSSASVFLDLSSVVDAAGEGGLLGVAFHPDFPITPEVYVSYTRSGSPLESYVSKFFSTDNGQTLNFGTEEVLLTVLQDATNHNGGDIKVGPDGNLYVAFGDGGGGGDPSENGQNTNNLLGTIVRVTVDPSTGTSIPADNPFAGNARCVQGSGGADCPEIYAWGLRNPWRMSFDATTGKLWAGDVGQSSWEEIDVIALGSNYGWDEREGAHCFEPATGCATNSVDPVSEYDRSVGTSVTGGFVYRGSAIPDLVGWYVFGDFGSGRLFAIPEGSATLTVPEILEDTSFQIVSFGQANDGELYFLDFSSGAIYRLIPSP